MTVGAPAEHRRSPSSEAVHMTSSSPSAGPALLAGLRVVDLTTGAGRLTGRLLADLGADVVRVDSGDVDADDLHRLAFDANKRSVRLDPSDDGDRQRLFRLIGTAGILVEDGRPGELAGAGLTDEALRQANPRPGGGVAPAVGPGGAER